jgi:hypothetical protein
LILLSILIAQFSVITLVRSRLIFYDLVMQFTPKDSMVQRYPMMPRMRRQL